MSLADWQTDAKFLEWFEKFHRDAFKDWRDAGSAPWRQDAQFLRWYESTNPSAFAECSAAIRKFEEAIASLYALYRQFHGIGHHDAHRS